MEREAGDAGADHNEGFPGSDCYLRIDRQGRRLIGTVLFAVGLVALCFWFAVVGAVIQPAR